MPHKTLNLFKPPKNSSDITMIFFHLSDFSVFFLNVCYPTDLEYLTNVQQRRTQKKKLPTKTKAKVDKGGKGKRKRTNAWSSTEKGKTESDPEVNKSEDECEEKKRKKLSMEAKAKKAAKAKAAKEALLKQRLQQAKTFQIKNQISSSSHECSEELSDSESERACSLQQAKVSPSQQSHSSSLGYSGSLIMVDSESEPLNSSEDEYFPGDEEMHADDDFVGMEVTVPYRSPLKELFQKGMSKFWAVEKPVVSIPTT